MSDAKDITIASFVSSDGWKLVKPIQIQRFAPPSSVPTMGTSIRNTIDTASTIKDAPRQI